MRPTLFILSLPVFERIDQLLHYILDRSLSTEDSIAHATDSWKLSIVANSATLQVYFIDFELYHHPCGLILVDQLL